MGAMVGMMRKSYSRKRNECRRLSRRYVWCRGGCTACLECPYLFCDEASFRFQRVTCSVLRSVPTADIVSCLLLPHVLAPVLFMVGVYVTDGVDE